MIYFTKSIPDSYINDYIIYCFGKGMISEHDKPSDLKREAQLIYLRLLEKQENLDNSSQFMFRNNPDKNQSNYVKELNSENWKKNFNE